MKACLVIVGEASLQGKGSLKIDKCTPPQFCFHTPFPTPKHRYSHHFTHTASWWLINYLHHHRKKIYMQIKVYMQKFKFSVWHKLTNMSKATSGANKKNYSWALPGTLCKCKHCSIKSWHNSPCEPKCSQTPITRQPNCTKLCQCYTQRHCELPNTSPTFIFLPRNSERSIGS